MNHLPQQIIARKRDGHELTPDEINTFVQAAATAAWPDYQLSALLMAIYLRGMTPAETAALTTAMMRSGTVVQLGQIPQPKIDKHSTGGVGDKVSIHLAPMIAACGVTVPMISGRGLGHTGGTLDKLESIPGYTTALPLDKYTRQLADIGLALVGQTAELAPADKKLYALRDVTATVESLPLICGSIMCKKMAEGIDALVLDVKYGRGAFMKEIADARRLARMMCDTGRAMNKPTRALITAMHEPLGRAIGNALEIAESIQCLRGQGPADLMQVTNALAVQMLLLAKTARDETDARQQLDNAINTGAALEKFRQMIAAQNGDPAIIDTPDKLPSAPIIKPFYADNETHTHITDVDAMGIAQAALRLGAGRTRAEDPIDPAVGIDQLVKIGEKIPATRILCRIHARDEKTLAEAEHHLRQSIATGPTPGTAPALIAELIE